jgi:hypothetical protein
MNRARLILTAIAASAALIVTPAAASAATPPSQVVKAQIDAQRAVIGSFDAAITGIRAQMAANDQQIMIFRIQYQSMLASGPNGVAIAEPFRVQVMITQNRNLQLAGTLGNLYNQRAFAQMKLTMLLATP